MYATINDFRQFYQDKEFEELGNIDNESMGDEESRVNNALLYAFGEINQILAQRYVLPIVVVVPFLRWANIVIARKNLASLDNTEKVRQDYEDIIFRLKEAIADNGFLVDENGNPINKKPDLISSQYYSGKMYSGERKAETPNFGDVPLTHKPGKRVFIGIRKPYW